MKTALLAVVATALISAAPAFAKAPAGKPAQDAASKALAPLQGTWTITSINGQDPSASGATMTITFSGDKYSQTVNGTVNERGTVKLGVDKKLTTIDLAITEGDDANKLQVGLVEVSGSTMKLKLALPGQTTRPTDFARERGCDSGAVDEKREGLEERSDGSARSYTISPATIVAAT